MSASRVFVLGNACLDLRIELPRLPGPGETLLGANPSRAPGGKGLNQAVAAARAGAAVRLLAPFGDDAVGSELMDALAREELATLVTPRMKAPTDYSVLMVLPDGENSITGAGPCAAALAPGDAEAFLSGVVAGDLLLMQGNLAERTTREALGAARARGACTMLNTAPLWWDMRKVLPLCDVIVANRGEAATLTGDDDPAGSAGALASHGAIAIVTLGAEGCILAQPGESRRFAPQPVRAVDTTGCGDAFCGVLAARLVDGVAIDDAICSAQKAAAITATRPGAFAALPTRAELAR